VFIDALAKFQKMTISLVMSICPSLCLSAWNNSVTNGRIFMKFDIRMFFFIADDIKVPVLSNKNKAYFT
jgi:hypothetical protein